MYKLSKNIIKLIKYGSKYGKGLATSYTSFTRKAPTDSSSFLGQTLGMLLLPLFYFIFEPLLRKLPKSLQQKVPVVLYAGVTAGSCIGATLSSSLLKNLPSSEIGLLGVGIGFAIAACVAVGNYLLGNKDEEANEEKLSENEKKTAAAALKQRFWLGLEFGIVVGAGFGASAEFIHPGVGAIVSAVGSLLGSIAGVTLAIVAPRYLKNPDSLKKISHILKTLRTGSLIGSGIGVVVGALLLPGIGPVIGGLIGSGILGTVFPTATWLITKSGWVKKESAIYKLLTNTTELSKLTLQLKISVAGGSVLGAIIGTVLFPGLGTVAGSALGALFGTLVGAWPTINRIYTGNLQEKNPNDKEAQIPFYRKAKLGYSVGCSIGAVAGAVIGSIIPGIGTLLGGLAGAFIGGIIGILTTNTYQNITENTAKPPLAVPVKIAAPQQPIPVPTLTDTTPAIIAQLKESVTPIQVPTMNSSNIIEEQQASPKQNETSNQSPKKDPLLPEHLTFKINAGRCRMIDNTARPIRTIAVAR